MSQQEPLRRMELLGDDGRIRASCETLSHFDEESFPEWGRTRNAILLPREAFRRVNGLEEFGYAEAFPEGHGDSTGVVVQVAGFSDDHDSAAYTSSGRYEACVRSTMQDRIGVDTTRGDQHVELRPIELPSVHGLTVERVRNTEQTDRDIVTHGSVCYIHEATRRELGVEEEDVVEVLNPTTGARICLPIKVGDNVHYDEEWIRLDRNTRKLLGVEADRSDEVSGVQEVSVRVPADLTDRSRTARWWRRATEWLGRRFVDYTTVRLRVTYGRDRDEDRNIVRLDPNTMKSLGIDEHDKAVLQWNKRQINARCLEDIEADGTGPLEVRVPSTERDKLEVSVGDCVDVRRNMRYAAGKKMAVSLLGILGVLLGSNQLLLVVDRLDMAPVIGLFSVLSVVIAYFILLPERQKCR